MTDYEIIRIMRWTTETSQIDSKEVKMNDQQMLELAAIADGHNCT